MTDWSMKRAAKLLLFSSRNLKVECFLVVILLVIDYDDHLRRLQLVIMSLDGLIGAISCERNDEDW